MLSDDDRFDVLADLHTEADLGERCVPVGRQLGFVMVEPSLPSWKVKVDLVAPQFGFVMECWLHKRKEKD